VFASEVIEMRTATQAYCVYSRKVKDDNNDSSQ
jgi:hypothetical protein